MIVQNEQAIIQIKRDLMALVRYMNKILNPEEEIVTNELVTTIIDRIVIIFILLR